MDQSITNMEDKFSAFTHDAELVNKAVEDCPFSALSRLLHLKQSREHSGITDDLEQLTALYFTNPLWMQYILNSTQHQVAGADADVAAFIAPSGETISNDQPGAETSTEQQTGLVEENQPTASEDIGIVHDENPAESFDESDEELIPRQTEMDEENQSSASEDAEIVQVENDGESDEQSIPQQTGLVEENQPTASEDVEIVHDENPAESFDESDEELIPRQTEMDEENQSSASEDVEIVQVENDDESDEESIPQQTGLVEENQPTASEDVGIVHDENPAESFDESDEELIPQQTEMDEENQSSASEDAEIVQVENDGESDEESIPQQTRLVEEKLEKHPDEDIENDVAFEPMHTIDYFASLGIHLTEQDLTNDRLGRQLKSFTGWLKSMKKVHPTQFPGQDEEVEQIIQRAAEISNLDTKVLTEAMAEVLVKQNKKDRAVQLYEKLSLMDPSKSAYFAAKIEKLKTS